MAELDAGFSFSLSCRCKACRWSMPIDELKAKGGKLARQVDDVGSRATIYEIVAPGHACPRCEGSVFLLRFSM